ncbi:MAG TPA: M20 family metallopeptidase [Spirochaetales bacterium]|nr:M20 family metallopeptidase [Spirochaetales bacterium]HPM72383.1 M20 family metallopeptidase [Spirochaetales bacterium]
MTDAKKLRIDAWDIRPWLVEIRRALHRHPELGLEEHRTADFIEARLEEMGVERERRGTAVVGLVRGARPGRTVALRADIDALPIREETGAEYASEVDGVMHACGHDAHTAILLGVARWFAERRAELAGNVKLLFQPAEETVGGAATMIADGCLEHPRVDFVLGLHVMPYLPVGRVETRKGALNGSSTDLRVVVRGLGCHAAYPERGVDAVMIAAQVVNALHTLVSRSVSPLDSAVLTIGTIQGGTASNVVADEVTMNATLRTASDEVRDLLVSKARAVVEGVPAALGGSGSLEVAYGYAALVNDSDVVDVVTAAADDVLCPGNLEWKERPSMGVEDFSFFCKERPGAFYHLGCGNLGRGIVAPLHASTFDLDEDCLPLGVAMQVSCALRLLERI